eukprot:TRINITY_DN39966_c0_g1_i1.p1 TRINITY_DN39966_c0_g1~~TRINITY_DN39966_c0_g1_i1.p1  ORF type:complete len:469 (+),score=62.23 TRINITY_DN39966_c0_g1_i1:149-1555(+)
MATAQTALELQNNGLRDRVRLEAQDAEPPSPLGDESHDRPPVKILLLAFMFMFQGYGVMNGNPAHALKHELGITQAQAGAFQNATASFQLAKLLMRILQVCFLAVMEANGIVYVAYVIMFIAVLVPVFLVWTFEISDLWVVYLQYSLGGVAMGLYEGTFLSAISPLGKNTKTYAIMGAPLGFAVHNIVLGTFQQWGMPVVIYYIYSACCLPVGMAIFYYHAPTKVRAEGKGLQIFMHSMKKPLAWIPMMIPWFIAKFCGNFVLEDAFPLLFNVYNTPRVPLFGGPDSTTGVVSFQYFTAWYWFVMVALGDTVSRRVPHYISLKSWTSRFICITVAILCCVVGEALNFLLQAIVAGFAAFIAYFGNGFIYGLSSKFIDAYVQPEHRYAAYNLWCLSGDLGGYAGQSSLSVQIAAAVCQGKHYTNVCHLDATTTTTTAPTSSTGLPMLIKSAPIDATGSLSLVPSTAVLI